MPDTPSPRWEWTLGNGARIAAELEPTANRERVFVGSDVVSESDRARKPDGHSIVAPAVAGAPGARSDEAVSAVVAFESQSAICILRVDGVEVAPSKWPAPHKRIAPPPASSSPPWGLLAAAVAIALIAGIGYLAWSPGPTTNEELASSRRADSGLFIAHFPASLKARPAALPPPLGGVVLEDEATHESILLAAFAMDSTIAPDAWILQQRYHQEVLADLPKAARTYVEGERREEKCLNEPGAVITARFDRPNGAHMRVWSCAFVKEGRGYFVAYALPSSAKDARVRRIVDGTELTQLANLGAPR